MFNIKCNFPNNHFLPRNISRLFTKIKSSKQNTNLPLIYQYTLLLLIHLQPSSFLLLSFYRYIKVNLFILRVLTMVKTIIYIKRQFYFFCIIKWYLVVNKREITFIRLKQLKTVVGILSKWCLVNPLNSIITL